MDTEIEMRPTRTRRILEKEETKIEKEKCSGTHSETEKRSGTHSL